MTRRYTGAEARELAAKATPGPWIAGQYNGEPGVMTPDPRCRSLVCAMLLGPTEANAALCAAAPDLAESLAAVEAERDALRVERDAYREYYRARQALITADDADSTSVLFAAEDRVSAARERIAALREAAK